MFSTLVSAPQLMDMQAKGQSLVLFDCSFDLMNPALGAQHYLETHIPSARHADLDQHLSDKSGAADRASGGRHPLPAREKFAAWLRSQGVARGAHVTNPLLIQVKVITL